MEINIEKDNKTRMVFELKGEDDTFCNLLKEELNKDDNVRRVSYNIDHPLVGEPKMVVEAKNARKSLKKAIKSLKKEFKDFKKEIKKVK